LLALGTLLALILPRSARQGRPMSVEPLKGGKHECAAAVFPSIGDIGDSGGKVRIWASGGACGYADRY
jgi:hypothetical protein